MTTTTPELVITRGYQGSGKTTLAREWVAAGKGRVRVNRDDLRHSQSGTYWGPEVDERAVTIAQQAAVEALLSAGRSVIVDDTNLKLRVARAWADLAAKAGVEFRVLDVTTDRDECIRRDLERKAHGGRSVGEEVIRDYATRYPMPWPEVKPTEKATWAPTPYVADTRLRRAILLDVDGTIAHNDGHRGWYDWAKVVGDTPKRNIIRWAQAIADAENATIVIMSGREDVCRAETEAWLAPLPLRYGELHMRQAGDQRPDDVVKAELFDKYVRYRWNVLGVLDDRDRVVRMWRAMGLDCLQVAEGDF